LACFASIEALKLARSTRPPAVCMEHKTTIFAGYNRTHTRTETHYSYTRSLTRHTRTHTYTHGTHTRSALSFYELDTHMESFLLDALAHRQMHTHIHTPTRSHTRTHMHTHKSYRHTHTPTFPHVHTRTHTKLTDTHLGNAAPIPGDRMFGEPLFDLYIARSMRYYNIVHGKG
jgi:hypothetical protein